MGGAPKVWAVLLLLGFLLCAIHPSVAQASDGGETNLDEEILSEDLPDDESPYAMTDEELADSDLIEDVLNEAVEDEPGATDVDFDQKISFPLSYIGAPLDGVSVASTFRQDISKKMLIGEVSETLIAFANEAKEDVHVWGIMGSLNVEDNFRSYVQNFTYAVVNATIPVGSQFSMTYNVKPYERLEAQNYQLALTVFYEKEKNVRVPYAANYATTFFNQTVYFDHPPGLLDNTTFFILVVLVTVLLLALFGGYKAYQSYVKNKNRQTKLETGTRAVVDDEWTEAHKRMINSGGGRTKTKGKAA